MQLASVLILLQAKAAITEDQLGELLQIIYKAKASKVATFFEKTSWFPW